MLNRRDFLAVAAGGAAGSVVGAVSEATGAAQRRARAIVFDAFPIFDPRPVLKLAEELFPGKGTELISNS